MMDSGQDGSLWRGCNSLPNRTDETGCHKSDDQGGKNNKEHEIEEAQKSCWSKKHQPYFRDNSHILVSTGLSIAQEKCIEILPAIGPRYRFPDLCQGPRDRCHLPAQLVVSTDTG
jgi:hypothetical protein